MSSAESCVVDTGKLTFRAAISGLAAAASGTDIFTITGSAQRKIKVLKIEVSGIATAAAAIPWQIIKRSAANTGGTSTTPTCVPMETNAGIAAQAVVRAYTVNPGALGTSAGLIEAKRGTVLTAAAGTPASPTVFDFTTSGAKYPTLNGSAEVLALNLGGGTYAGNAYDIFCVWTEE